MLISFEQAIKKILKNTKQLPIERVPVAESVGAVLMEDVKSQIAMPPFDKSVMDGYALKAADIKDAPRVLKNIGVIQAGSIFRKKVTRGQCAKIMTGAALPQGADTVVKVEDTVIDNGRVRISVSMPKGAHVYLKASDVRKGQTVKEKGSLLETSDVAILAGAGRASISVTRRPSVAFLNTGGEIVDTGKARPGTRQVYNCSGPQLSALLTSDGFDSVNLGIARDKGAELTRAIKKGLMHDVLLITGGVSKGDFDLVPGVLKNLGVKKIFHGVWVKPGKPLYFGMKGRSVVFGVPGNPVSSFLVYQAYVRTALLKMMGRKACVFQAREGVLAKMYSQNTNRRHFVPVKIIKNADSVSLVPVVSHGSADILALSKADGFMIVKERARKVASGTIMKFITWKQL